MTDFQKSLRVDVSDAGALSLLFTAVLVKTNQKHPLPVKSEDYALKYLPRVFTSTSNSHGKRTLRGFMRVCEGLIIKWQKAHYDEVARGRTRKRILIRPKGSAKSASREVKAGERCEGCGKPRHKRESCQLAGYSDTLCSLSVLRSDRPHVPQERRRSRVEPFATHSLHRAEPDSPDELLAMIQFAETPALQEPYVGSS
jgi:hypothetical protein